MVYRGLYTKKLKVSQRRQTILGRAKKPIDFLHFLAQCRKSLQKMTYQKKNRVHWLSKIIKSMQSYSNVHLSYHCSFYCLAQALMHNMTCKFACTIRTGCTETIIVNIFKLYLCRTLHTCSNPGSLWYGFSFKRDWIEINTLDRDCAGLQAGPDHVLQSNKTKINTLYD